jgi:alcohol dehydrogenase
MNPLFTFTGAKKIVFGKGALERLPEYLAELKAKRPLVVLDGSLSRAGLRERVSLLLKATGGSPAVYDAVEGEPALEQADEGARLALENQCDVVVGIGGGSAMDAAKAMAAVAGNRARAVDFLGLNRVPGPGLPTVMVPTTAGTGSEVTFTAVFIRKDLKKKEGMNSPYLYPDLALLDPLLTVGLPPLATATTGMDALCHAIESYTSVNASPMSALVSLEAVRLIGANLRTAVHDGSNLRAREAMLLGSLYAGLGLANAGVTAVHSLSYPLGGRFGVPHGLANTILLPAVMEFNLPGALEKFAHVAGALGEDVEGMPPREAAPFAVEAVAALIRDCGVPMGIGRLGVREEDFPDLAAVAMTVARPLANNPRRVTAEDAVLLYREAF